MRRIDPASLLEHPLMLRTIGEGDFAIVVAGLPLGRIMRKPVSGGKEVWFWTLTGPYVPESLFPKDGDAPTLEGAKTAIKGAFERWLAWAQGQGEVVWHG